jgi:menaquinone-dependent protoporphyrinogen oxidase
MDVLIAYATTHGQAAKVAQRVAEVAGRRGDRAHVERLSDGHDPSPKPFDAVVVAGSVHAGRHQRELVRWARRHHTTLNIRPTALLTVSLSAAEDSYEARADVRLGVDRLLDDTGWIPTEVVPVAGALHPRDYDTPTRILLRLTAGHHGQPAGADHDVEYTDWTALERSAEAFLATASGDTPEPAAATATAVES